MKLLITSLAILLFFSASAQEQYSISSQKDRLRQYSGQWVSAITTESDSLALMPNIKMSSLSTINNHALTVEVLRKDTNSRYQSVLHEIIGYDSVSDTIFAAGHNTNGAFFTGKGGFTSQGKWTMQDKDLNGNPTMRVDFQFQNYTDVILEGFDNNQNSLWKTRYIKQNPKDKHIGIQLVSVHKDMLKNPKATLKQLGRMGYSYVETFVYKDGYFYGYNPKEFKALVEREGMQFLGSMTFFDPEDKKDLNAIDTWWLKTIEDHKAAGVAYLSTSNSKIKEIISIGELKAYSDYYNRVGRLCKDNGLKFVFHNHADEFLTVEGIRVYDYFLQNTDPELVYFQSDVYWMNVAGVNPIEYFKKYPKRFISWHVKDYKELGASGKIDFKELFKHKKVSGLEYVVSEVEAYSFPPLFSIGLAWEYIYYELLNEEIIHESCISAD